MKMLSDLKKFLCGFGCAFSGIAYAVKTQVNFRFHITAMIWVLLLSRLYELTGTEYALLFLTFSSVLALEAVNTAVEKAVDFTSKEKSPLAKAAKDVSAGAVLIAAIFSVAVAFCLFWDSGAVFARIACYFADKPFMVIAAIAGAALSFIFIFGIKKDDNNGN